MDIGELISTIAEKGILRNNKYYTYLEPPQRLTVSSDTITGLRTLAHSVSSPNFNFGTYEFTRLGTPIELPNTQIFEDLTVSYYTQGDASQFGFFYDWKDLIFDQESKTFNFLDEYSGNYKIDYLNDMGDIAYSITYNMLYPKNVSQTQLSYEEQDALFSFDVTYAYQNYTINR